MIISFRNEGEIKTFSDEGKLREFVTIRPATKEMLEEFYQIEEKWYQRENSEL